MPLLISLIACLLSALLLAFSFPLSLPPELMQVLDKAHLQLPGWNSGGFAQLPWLVFIAFVPLLGICRLTPNPLKAAGYGYLTGVLWLIIHLDWVGSFGVLPVIMLTLFFALPMALFAYFAQRLLHENSAALLCWGLPLLWTAIEYLRGFGFWALPWNLLGYSQTASLNLIQVADMGGVFAVSFLIVLGNCVLLLLFTGHGGGLRVWAHALIGAGLICGALGYGSWRISEIDRQPREQRIKVALVQAGVSTRDEWNGSQLIRMLGIYEPASEQLAMDWTKERQSARDAALGELTEADGFVPDFVGPLDEPQLLIVWPESCIPKFVEPDYPDELPLGIWTFIEKAENTSLLLGALANPHGTDSRENSALLVRGDHVIEWIYSKVRLVAFGEIVPFRGLFRIINYPWGSGDIEEGRETKSFELRGVRISPLICFDNVLGFLFMREARAGSDLFVLITNNSWYDLKSGIRQHADIDILRSVENRRPLARVSTTGWSHFIDPAGRVLQQSSTDKLATLSQWEGRSSGLSLYTRFGDVFAQLCVLLSLMLCSRVLLAHRSEGWL
jgi:apolipoprotein N-acyltransferase